MIHQSDLNKDNDYAQDYKQSYQKALCWAIGLHLFLASIMFFESVNQLAIFSAVKSTPRVATATVPSSKNNKEELLQAATIDNAEVKQIINRLKEERANIAKAQQNKQLILEKRAAHARELRKLEQEHLTKIKTETAKLALARNKQIAEDQRHLKQLAFQKEQEQHKLKELATQQQQLQKKQALEALKLLELQEAAAQLKQKHEQEAKRHAQEEIKRRQALLKQEAATKANIASEIEKYKTLITDAISRQWILPENIDKNAKSLFRIRLAEDGSVLEASLIQSSGDVILDRSAQTAIHKASPLPVPKDPTIFTIFRDIKLTVNPQNVRV